MVLYTHRKEGNTMFGIKSNGMLDNELFNEMYLENEKIIEDMLFYVEKNPKLLEVKLDELGYDKVREVLAFLENCEVNYTTINLMSSLEGYCQKKEDEIFLDLYMAIQEGNLDEWLGSCDMTKINMLYKNFKDDRVISLLFPDIREYVLQKEKALHR